MKIDLHTHSKYSADALTKPETMIKTAKKEGIGLAITDHDTTKAWKELTALGKKHKVPLVLGEEIATFHNGRFAGELMGLFLQEEIKSTEYLEVIDEIKSQGALLVAPHPFDWVRRAFKYVEKELKKIDALEAYNSRCYMNLFNKRAQEFCKKHSKPFTAGSDAHTPEEIGNAIIETKSNSLEGFRKDLIKRNAVVEFRKAPYRVHVWTQLAKYKLVGDR